MGLYSKYILPLLINKAMQAPEMARIRRRLIPLATGKVIETGIGSGLNLPYYDKDVEITGIDPSEELQAYAVEVAREANLPVDFIARGSEEIPFADNHFDTAVVTWSLCTISEPGRALAELRRVLKPGGRLIFVEHGLSPDMRIARWQHRINPVWKRIGGGCNLNRRPDELIEASGFTFEEIARGYIRGPKIAAWTCQGVARSS